MSAGRWAAGSITVALVVATASADPAPELLASVPTDVRTWSVRFAPDARQVGWIAAHGAGERLVVNGEPGPTVDRVNGRYLLGAGGRRHAYLVQVGDRWHPVIDHQVGEGYDAARPPVSDGSGHLHHVAFAVRLDERWYLRLDDDLHGPYDAVRDIRVSADGHHVAWIARRDGADRVVCDGEPVAGSQAPRCAALAIHPTRPLVSYLRDGRPVARCVVGSTTVLWPRDAIRCALGPDAARAYVVSRRDGRQQCWWARRRGPIHDMVLGLVIAPTGARWAALGLDGEREVVTVDGRRQLVGERPAMPVFSPDGAHVAWRAEVEGEPVIVLDGVPSGPLPGCGRNVAFSANGTQVVFGQRRENACWREVRPVDGWPGERQANPQGDSPR